MSNIPERMEAQLKLDFGPDLSYLKIKSPLAYILETMDFPSLNSLPESTVKEIRRPRYRQSGYVYFIGRKGNIKIGYSTNYHVRVASLCREYGKHFPIIRAIKHREARKLEKALHVHFSDRRIRGEWFCLEKKDAFSFKIKDIEKALIPIHSGGDELPF